VLSHIYSIFILYPLKKPLYFQTFIIQAVLLAMLIFLREKYNAFTAFNGANDNNMAVLCGYDVITLS